MSILTNFLKLLKPEPNDYVDVEKHISENYDKIDNKIEELDGYINKKTTQTSTIAELQSRKNLKVGDIVEVLGYYEAGDGAGHKRIIANEDDGSGVQLNNKLYANIVHNGEVNVSWFGTKKNIDSYEILNKVSSYLKNSMILNIDMDLVINFIPNSTIDSPTRVVYRDIIGLTIKGYNHTIQMLNVTKEYLETIEDGTGRDVFTAFSFIRCENVYISDLKFIGTYAEESKFKYTSPRTKCIGFIGCKNCTIERIYSKNSLGNLLCTTPTSIKHDGDGVYRVCSKIFVNDCHSDGSWENAINFMGGTKDSVVSNCSSTRAGSCCVEIGGENNKIIGCTSYKDRIGFSLGAKNSILTNSFVFDSISDLWVTFENATVKNNIFKNSTGWIMYFLPQSTSAFIENNLIINNDGKDVQYKTMMYGACKEEITFVNNIIKNNLPEASTFLLRTKRIIISGNSIYQQDVNKHLVQGLLTEGGSIMNNIISSKVKLYLNEKQTSNPYPIEINNIIENILSVRSGTQEPTEYITAGTYFFNTKTKDAKFFDGTNWITYQKVTPASQLSTTYMSEKMKQENVYDDYISYMDEKTLYDKQQRNLEQDRQLAYEQALKENPNLSYEDFMALQPMTLNLVEEPQPSKALQAFMEKYL